MAYREARCVFADRDPQVLIVGGGHSGLMAAAHLGRLDVDTLVVDRFGRIGDNWRTRYDSLVLHNNSDMNQFPFMPFPPTFPEYLPKDKLANWLEVYVDCMEINAWTSTEFLGGRFDDAQQGGGRHRPPGRRRAAHAPCPRHPGDGRRRERAEGGGAPGHRVLRR